MTLFANHTGSSDNNEEDTKITGNTIESIRNLQTLDHVYRFRASTLRCALGSSTVPTYVLILLIWIRTVCFPSLSTPVSWRSTGKSRICVSRANGYFYSTAIKHDSLRRSCSTHFSSVSKFVDIHKHRRNGGFGTVGRCQKPLERQIPGTIVCDMYV